MASRARDLARAGTKILDGVAANASAANRTTDWIQVADENLITIECNFTHNAATEVQIKVEQLSVDGSTAMTKQSRSSSNALSDWSETKTVSADADWVSDIPINSAQVRFVFSTTSGGASDTMTMYVHEARKV